MAGGGVGRLSKCVPQQLAGLVHCRCAVPQCADRAFHPGQVGHPVVWCGWVVGVWRVLALVGISKSTVPHQLAGLVHRAGSAFHAGQVGPAGVGGAGVWRVNPVAVGRPDAASASVA